MFQKLRIKVINELAELNEKFVFNQKIIKYYKNRLPSQLKSVIDVGVNIGQSIEIFKKISSDSIIIGFEPNPKLFELLTRKYSGNSTIQLHQLGISNHCGLKIFHENVLHTTSGFEELNFESDYLARKAKILGVKKENIIRNSYEVEVTTLSNFINTNCSSDIDILKIDTEGHEYYCLEGLFLTKLNVNVKYIQIEEHDDDMYLNKKPFDEINDLLETNGYKIDAKIPHGFGNFVEVIFKKI
jgi:FkbM family methyltransferase